MSSINPPDCGAPPDDILFLQVEVAGSPIIFAAQLIPTHKQEIHGCLKRGVTTSDLRGNPPSISGRDRAIFYRTHSAGRRYRKSFTLTRWQISRDVWATGPLPALLGRFYVRRYRKITQAKIRAPSRPHAGIPLRMSWPISQGGRICNRRDEAREVEGPHARGR